MKRVHIIGRKNSGKTTLVVDLVEHLSERGFCVGTIKHTHHRHELDTPGKDSYQHRTAGASVVGILSRDMTAVFKSTVSDQDISDRYAKIEPAYRGCDLVLVEGNSQTDELKLEVWRKETETDPIALTDDTIHAIVSYDAPPVSQPVWPRGNIEAIADQVLDLLDLQKTRR